MLNGRDSVLRALRAARRPRRPRPPAGVRPAFSAAETLERLRIQLEAAGGRLRHISRLTLPLLSRELPALPAAEHVWSALPQCAPRGVGAHGRSPEDLTRLDFTLLRGELAVAENGALWNVPRSRDERLAALLAQHLVVVVTRGSVVSNLHEAYARIDPRSAAFGWFLSGPSKTADIEQALVFGAQGPREMTLVLSDSDLQQN